MQYEKVPASSATIATVERLLTEAFGGPVRLDGGDDLGGSNRSKVYRFQIVEGPTTAPASVVVKHANLPPGTIPLADSAKEWTLANDWAAIQFLSECLPDTALAPRFYAGDWSRRLFVMEDLGQGERLDHALLGHDPDVAEAALIAFAALHGKLHALTIGRQEEYKSIREVLGPIGDIDYCAQMAPALHRTATLLDIRPDPGVDAELAQIAEALAQPGPFHAFIQADACPDNIIRAGTGWRLLDFEGARFTHALLEGVYGRVLFPTCWCLYRLPEQVMLRMEAAYRAELVQGCPLAADDETFYRAVAQACIFWLCDTLAHRPLDRTLENDRALIALSDRRRFLLFFDNLVQTLEAHPYFPAVHTTIATMARELHRRWSEIEDIPCYPAFQ